MEVEFDPMNILDTPYEFDFFNSGSDSPPTSALDSPEEVFETELPQAQLTQVPTLLTVPVKIPASIIIGVNIQTRSIVRQLSDDVMSIYSLLNEYMGIYGKRCQLKLTVQVYVVELYAHYLLKELQRCLSPSGVEVVKRQKFKQCAFACVVRDTEPDSPTEVLTWESFYTIGSQAFHNLTGKDVYLYDATGGERRYMPDSSLPSLCLAENEESRELKSYWNVPVRLPATHKLMWLTKGPGFDAIMLELPSSVLVSREVAEHLQKLPVRVRAFYVDGGPGKQYHESATDIHGTGLIVRSSGLNHSWY